MSKGHVVATRIGIEWYLRPPDRRYTKKDLEDVDGSILESNPSSLVHAGWPVPPIDDTCRKPEDRHRMERLVKVVVRSSDPVYADGPDGYHGDIVRNMYYGMRRR